MQVHRVLEDEEEIIRYLGTGAGLSRDEPIREPIPVDEAATEKRADEGGT